MPDTIPLGREHLKIKRNIVSSLKNSHLFQTQTREKKKKSHTHCNA